MWPKVFAQLVELLPQISRLIPMADIFFTNKNAGEKASEAVLQALAKDVRSDLSGVTSAHDGLYRQLQEQSGRIGELEIETRRTRTTLEEQLVLTAALQKQVAALVPWIKAAVFLLVIAIALLIAVLWRH